MGGDATTRFSSRVHDYVRYRPSYPATLIPWLHSCGVAEDGVVADVGSGTGIFTRLLLDAGHRVYAVEPNADMRAEAERGLTGRDSFSSVAARAEETTLADASIDLITVAQAFHWFEPDATRREFARIAKPGALVALIWNDRDLEGDDSALMRGYEALLEEWGTDYKDTTYRFRRFEDSFAHFFARPYRQATFPNSQTLDEDGLVGRFVSSSYAPGRDHPRYAGAERATRQLFAEHQRDGRALLTYVTRVYLGAIGDRPPATS